MDRNPVVDVLPERDLLVALRKESVDRNFQVCTIAGRLFQSLSARRAWIEIWPVAILLISVKSLSARRAWIEMFVIDWAKII